MEIFMDQYIFTIVERLGAVFSSASETFVTDLFRLCVNFMYFVAGLIGISYEALNIWLFIIIQPGLILLFFALWMRERAKLSKVLN